MSTNPFDDEPGVAGAARGSNKSKSSRTTHRPHRGDAGGSEPSIWAARSVEWPIPSSLSLANYQKLVKSSKADSVSTSALDRKDEGADEDTSNYLGFGGLMSRVLNTSGTSATDEVIDEYQIAAASGSGARPLRPPRTRCVAASNGWIVSVLEVASAKSSHGASQTARRTLVSRWNVRRGSSISTDPWLALPGTSEIAHVFVDPTGCHTLLSAHNGDAYYLHSSSRSIQKILAGRDGAAGLSSPPSGMGQSGVSATMAARAHQPDSVIQAGFTRGSYVTAVAWDRESGTEGSSKPILLGTSAGELYEYTLDSTAIGAGGSIQEAPLLLHKLYTAEASNDEVAAVTGLHFERLAGAGMIILVATSERHKRTRLFTFHSFGSHTSFRSVLAQQTSLVELPGSIDFAELKLCNEHFALRTATGIYYGTIDRNSAATGSTGVIVDAGLLSYGDWSKSESIVPVSIALTPHHLIALSESDEVRFVNRVAQKTIQKEHVDWLTASTSTGLDESMLSTGELLMDVRRPDQVWLRKARSLVHISSTCEDRDVWKYTLTKCLEMPQTPVAGRSPAKRPGLGLPEFARQMSTTPTIHVLSEGEKAQEEMFEYAKTLCTNDAQKAVVTAARAEYHLLQGRAELAAKYMAQCPPTLAPFAGTSIRLALPMLGIDDPRSYGQSVSAKRSLGSSNLALITYLSDKMQAAKIKEDSVACTMVGAWLAELYLHERERSQTSALGIATSTRRSSRGTEASQQALLNQFLTNNVNNMDAKTIMRILASHDVSATESATFAAASGDIGTAVSAALQVQANEMAGAQDAIRILNEAPFEVAEPYYYKHAATLLTRAPSAACQSFLARYSQGLSPSKLLPSIMHYEKLRAERRTIESLRGGVEETKAPDIGLEALVGLGVEGSNSAVDGVELRFERHDLLPAPSFVDDETASTSYLEGVIKAGCRSSAVFTYLVSLYTDLEDEEPLLGFLSKHIPAASTVLEANQHSLHAEPSMMLDNGVSAPLDLSFTLRTVLASGRHFRSAIKLYMGFGFRQQAVELALNVDPVLARQLARQSVNEDERRRLWLMIARKAAAGGDGRGGKDVVARVVSVLKDCGPDVLSIEDVLPFLPEFAEIDQIKDEICDALTSYSSKIEGFAEEMNECDQTCENLREEISRLRSHRMHMRADARCALSNKLVLNAGEPFYVFPSGYVFLEGALKGEVMPRLNERQRARVEAVVDSIAELRLTPNTVVSEKDETNLEGLQAELDGLIAAECPLTGSIMVDCVDQGFDDCVEADEFLIRRAREQVDAEADSFPTP